MDIVSLIQLCRDYGLQVALAAVLIFTLVQAIRILLDEDRSAQFRANIYKALYKVSGKKRYEKEFISNDISARLNLARKRLHFSTDILPTAVSIDWVPNATGTTYDIQEGEYVVCLDPAECQETNIVRLAEAIVTRTSLVGIRHLFEKPLEKAIDLNLTRSLLAASKNAKAIDWFFTNEYSPSILADDQLADWNAKVSEIDERGLFTRILLVEFAQFAKRVFGMTPRPFMIGEVEGLVRFVHAICAKQYRQDVPLEYLTAYIRVAVLLVANTSNILRKGINPYLRSIAINTEKGVDTIYVIVWDKNSLGERDAKAFEEFERKAQALSAEIRKQSKLIKAGEYRYEPLDSDGNRRKATCMRYVVERR